MPERSTASTPPSTPPDVDSPDMELESAEEEDLTTDFKLLGSSALAVGGCGAVSAELVAMRVLRMLWSLFMRSLGASPFASRFRFEMDAGCRGMPAVDFSTMPGPLPC